MDRISISAVGPALARAATLAVLVLAGLLVLASCGSESGTSATTPRQAASVATLEADLAPRLEEEFGPANLHCGSSDFFAGGVAAGELQSGNGINCLYMSGLEDEKAGKDPLIVNIVVLVTTPDDYSYTAHAVARAGTEEAPTPEWTYRDGLNCKQLTESVTDDTAPGPSFQGIGRGNVSGLTYPHVVYYWYDTGQPEEMDPDGDGRPCTDQFPEDDVVAVFDDTHSLTKVTTDTVTLADPLTTFDIRKSLEPELTDDETTQVDCDLAGPVGIGSSFTCAPRRNGPADHRVIAVINADGEFLVGRSSEDYRETGDPNSTYYRPGLTCAQLAAPLDKDTIATGASLSDLPKNLKNDGLSYEEAVLYAYFHQVQDELAGGSPGWPCADTYPADEVEAVQGKVRTAN